MNPFTNTQLVRHILSAEGLQFATPPAPPINGPYGSPEVTSLSFGTDANSGWTLILFTHPNGALLRMYSHVLSLHTLQPANVQRLLELLNTANFELLTDSTVEYSQPTATIRYRAAFHPLGIGLPVAETRNAIQQHIVRSNYLHHLLKAAYLSQAPDPSTAIRDSHFQARMATGQPTPTF
ncbi:hypothetical protein [Paraburkholderia tropica]|uniref:hypothetical protein n=1 Tax=Paraburkholderia tropica TaxID=92647 RepID=UPI002AB6A1F8|nr:hypothetical protein [Paraburkholderia tropica]